jgi:hypothetical protein
LATGPKTDLNSKAQDAAVAGQFTGFAVLVDGHEGDREGTILQHPFFSQISQPEGNLTDLQFQIEESMLKRLKEPGTYSYLDPVAAHPQGKNYSGEWIAAMEKVEIARRGSDEFERRQSTSLLLLVQVPAKSITVPVAMMGQKLAKLFLIAVVALLAAIVALWLFVLRFMRLPDSFAEAARTRNGTTEGRSASASDAEEA